jgi:SAM-dependent methyltransferase
MESTTGQLWEGASTHELLVMLIGYEMGRNPERHLDAIRTWRGNIVEYFDRCFLRLAGTESALEIGSGCGFTSRELARRVARLQCLDVSESFLAFARDECADVPNVSFQRGTYTDLSAIDPASVDAVLASAVFIHADLYSIDRFFSELARVVRDGGRVVFDFLDANRLEAGSGLFRQHAKEYRQNPAKYGELCKWNSGVALRRIARAHGFAVAVFPEPGRANSVLLAVRGQPSSLALKLSTAARMQHFLFTRPRHFLVPRHVLRT